MAGTLLTYHAIHFPMPKLFTLCNPRGAFFNARTFRRAFRFCFAVVLPTQSDGQVFHCNIHKNAVGYVSIQRCFANIGAKHFIALNFTQHSARGKTVRKYPLFDIADKIVIVAEFQRTTFRRHCQIIFVLRYLRAIRLHLFVMCFTVVPRPTAYLFVIDTSFNLFINGRQTNAEFFGNYLFA